MLNIDVEPIAGNISPLNQQEGANENTGSVGAEEEVPLVERAPGVVHIVTQSITNTANVVSKTAPGVTLGAAVGSAAVLGGFLLIGLSPIGPIAGGLFAANMGAGLVAGSVMSVTQSLAMTGGAYYAGAAIGGTVGGFISYNRKIGMEDTEDGDGLDGDGHDDDGHDDDGHDHEHDHEIDCDSDSMFAVHADQGACMSVQLDYDVDSSSMGDEVNAAEEQLYLVDDADQNTLTNKQNINVKISQDSVSLEVDNHDVPNVNENLEPATESSTAPNVDGGSDTPTPDEQQAPQNNEGYFNAAQLPVIGTVALWLLIGPYGGAAVAAGAASAAVGAAVGAAAGAAAGGMGTAKEAFPGFKGFYHKK